MFDARNMIQIVSFPKKQYIQTSCDISNDNQYLVSITNELSRFLVYRSFFPFLLRIY